ncbi:MAG: hypothetical protein KAI70_06035 [Candidatus Omnitrophica bacterium]|nr:hypothetical protein [Candidatus Omnitrophota bacterium]
MKKKLILINIFLFLCIAGVNTHTVYGQHPENTPALYRESLTDLAKNILISFDLLEEGKILYDKSDYSNAQQKFRQALMYDPGNSKAGDYLKLCNEKNKEQKHPKKKFDFLTELENKIQQLEREQTQQGSTLENIKTLTLVSDKTEHKNIRKGQQIKQAQRLLEEGNNYYKNKNYEKAFISYKKAFYYLNGEK